jgi:superfamily II DNA or RNA helicase
MVSTSVSVTIPVLRDYQKQARSDLYAKIREGFKRILLFAPTGSGKTLIASRLLADAQSKGRKSLFLVHRDILISQTAEKLESFNVNCGFIKSGWAENKNALVQLGSVQTMVKRQWWKQDFEAQIILIDECHITAFSGIVRQMMDQIYPNAIYIGLTATPYRLKKSEGMGDIFQTLVSAPMPHELIDSGYLSKPSYYGLHQPDLQRVKTVAGDYDEHQLAIACDKPELIQQLVKEWQKLAYGRRTIVFAVNVQHSQNICTAFNNCGIPAAHVDGKTSIKQRMEIYKQLAAKDIYVLCSCMTLTEGFDVPSVNAVILARPTQSIALYHQMVGRGLRLSSETEKRDCLVICQSGNVSRHGFIEEVKSVSLNPGEEFTGVEAPKKTCPPEDGGCGAFLYGFQMRCPECNYKFPELLKLPLIQQLEQLLSEEDKQRFDFYRSKLQFSYQNNYAPGWAAMIFQEKYGHFPPDDWARDAIFGESPTPEHQATYYKYLCTIAEQRQKPDTWVKRYMTFEFGRVQ